MTKGYARSLLLSTFLSLCLTLPGFSQDQATAQPSSDGHLSAAISQAVVKGGILTVKIALTNTSDKVVEPELRYQGAFTADFQNKLKYHGLKDADGKYQAGPQHYDWGGGTFKERLQPGEKRIIWIKFPAPARDTATIVLFLPGFLPLEEVKLTFAGEPGKAGVQPQQADPGLPIKAAGLPFAGEVVDIIGLPAEAYAGAAVKIDQMMRDLGGKKVGQETQVALPGDLLFDFDKWNIKKEAEDTLQKLSRLIKNLKKRLVVIEGHTDAKGSDTYNRKLSQRRAQAVKEWLQTKGELAGVKFRVKGYGEAKPVAPNTHPDGSDNPAGRAKNRRVEFRIVE